MLFFLTWQQEALLKKLLKVKPFFKQANYDAYSYCEKTHFKYLAAKIGFKQSTETLGGVIKSYFPGTNAFRARKLLVHAINDYNLRLDCAYLEALAVKPKEGTKPTASGNNSPVKPVKKSEPYIEAKASSGLHFFPPINEKEREKREASAFEYRLS